MSSQTQGAPRWWRNEDWLAVIVGGALIFAVLAGWRPEFPSIKWTGLGDLAAGVSGGSLAALAILVVVFGVFSFGVMALTGSASAAAVGGFAVVLVLGWLAQWIAGQSAVRAWGLEYVLFALLIGLILNHAFKLPPWLRAAVRTEFYIKTGLVILGATILFHEMMQAGALGLWQGAIVVTLVWGVTFRLARKLRVDDEFGAMLSSAVAICGVSAAIATCGAIQGDRKKLSYVTSIVLLVAMPMMVVMPWVVKAVGMPELVAGAWLGGTLDTSGSVVAAGQLISERATKAGVIVKFSQNVLIGVAAFVLSVWWSMRDGKGDGTRPKVSASVIWERFPKFVLGFVVASLVFSFALDPELAKVTKPVLNNLRNYWFAMAFVSIGLETHFGDLVRMEGGRPALAFLGGQAFNVVLTLILAWLLFGGVLFAVPDIR
ncbi:MAG: YeiH family protein [Limisphaerales bacterium]